MDKMKRDKLIPVISTNRKVEEKKESPPEFRGTIYINPIFSKQEDPFDLKITELSPEPKLKINKRKFNSYKQEQLVRLNRESKLKVNEQISDYIKYSKKRAETTPKARSNKKKNETEQLKDASKQMAEIHQILDCKRTIKVDKSAKKNLGEFNFGEKKAFRARKTMFPSTMKHMCIKNLENKLNNYNSIIEDFEKKLNLDPDVNQTNKFYFSTPDIIIPSGSIKKTVTANKKILDSISSRIKKSKDKFLSEETIKGTDPPSKAQTLLKVPYHLNKSKNSSNSSKYKSLKDIKLDQIKLKQFQEEVKNNLKLMDVPKETYVLYENDIFKNTNAVPKKSYFKEHKTLKDTSLSYKNIESPKSPSSELEKSTQKSKDSEDKNHLLFVDIPREYHPVEEFSKTLSDSTEKETQILFKRNFTPRTPKKGPQTKYTSPEKNVSSSKTVEASTGVEPENELERSIMKSDYLKKEFNVTSSLYPLLTKDKKKKKEVEAVNWADKFKIQSTRRWSKQMDYLTS